MINIVNIRNRWLATGMLKDLKTAKQEVELSKILELCSRTMAEMDKDGDLPRSLDTTLCFTALSDLYYITYVYVFLHNNVSIGTIPYTKMKEDNHKFNVQDIIDIAIELDSESEPFDGIGSYDRYEEVMISEIKKRYTKKHGYRL